MPVAQRGSAVASYRPPLSPRMPEMVKGVRRQIEAINTSAKCQEECSDTMTTERILRVS